MIVCDVQGFPEGPKVTVPYVWWTEGVGMSAGRGEVTWEMSSGYKHLQSICWLPRTSDQDHTAQCLLTAN